MFISDKLNNYLDPQSTDDFHKSNWQLRKFHLLMFVVILLVFSVLRLCHISDYGLWLDEVFSLQAASGSWNHLFEVVINDIVHPPLFYILLKIWVLVGGDSLLWLKILPLAFSILSIIPFYFIARRLNLKPAEFLTAFMFISFNDYLIYYAQELRMYSMLQFLSLVSIWIFIKFISEESETKNLYVLFIINFLLIYTQYFGVFVVLTQFFYICVWHRRLLIRYSLCCLALIVSFFPWVYFVYLKSVEKHGLGNNLGWIDKPQISSIYLFLAELHGTLPIRTFTSLGFIFLAFPLLIWLWQIIKYKNSESFILFRFLFLFSFVPILIAFPASHILTVSVFNYRYLIITAVPYLLLTAVAINRINPVWMRNIGLVVAILWAMGVGSLNIIAYHKRINWLKITNEIIKLDSQQYKRRMVFTTEPWTSQALENSLQQHTEYDYIVRQTQLDKLNRGEFWFVYRLSDWKDEKSPEQKFYDRNCLIQKEFKDETFKEKVNALLILCEQ